MDRYNACKTPQSRRTSGTWDNENDNNTNNDNHAYSSNVAYTNKKRKLATDQMTLRGQESFLPLRAPWKKNRTTKTCNPAIDTIIKPSITLKFQILRSVLRTVLKFRFSRVRKYFWFREMVDSCADSLKMDSSSADACSGLAPWREGSCARSSFSTWSTKENPWSVHCFLLVPSPPPSPFYPG